MPKTNQEIYQTDPVIICAVVILDQRLAVPHILTLVIILILIGFKKTTSAQGRRFLSSHFTMHSSKFIILALCKHLHVLW